MTLESLVKAMRTIKIVYNVYNTITKKNHKVVFGN